MSSSDCATIIKRGYLHDKKAGILDPKKKWFVLRRDPIMGYCILEYFKDERSWTRREPPKGFINVQDIVEVLRVPEKKQTIEFLCPGVGYRLMANSEADADDWAEVVKKLIIYRKDIHSMSFPRVVSQGGSSSSLSSSPPNIPFQSTLISSPLSHNALTIPPAFSSDGSHIPQHSPQQIQHQFPTPPQTIADMTAALTTPGLQKQGSNDGANLYPSPPSSNDSASMCGSSISFDSGSLHDGNDADFFHRFSNKFRVSIYDSDKFSIQGECDLIFNEDNMTLVTVANGSQIATWPLGSVRRYGVNSVCFTFESGRYCSTGEGQFFLYSHQSRLIYNKIHVAILKMNHKESRRSSAPIEPSMCMTTTSSGFIPVSRVTSMNDSLSSLPQYNHIDHQSKQSYPHEMYTKLQQTSPSAFSSPLSFGAFATTEYEKLSHSPQLLSSNMASTFSIKQASNSCFHTAVTQTCPEPVYSTLQEVDQPDKSIEEDVDDTLTTMSDDIPPPIPPRLSKVTTI